MLSGRSCSKTKSALHRRSTGGGPCFCAISSELIILKNGLFGIADAPPMYWRWIGDLNLHFFTIFPIIYIAGSPPVEWQCYKYHQTACPIC
jgi:hypothetical protein